MAKEHLQLQASFSPLGSTQRTRGIHQHIFLKNSPLLTLGAKHNC